MSDNGVLTRLAEQLPADFMRFRPSATQRMLSAGEFLQAGPLRGCSFDGKLTQQSSVEQVLTLIEDLLASPPRAIRSTSFSLEASDLRWKASTAGCVGRLELYDGRRGRQRFRLTAYLRCAGDSPDSPDVRSLIERIAEATHIPFGSGSWLRRAYCPGAGRRNSFGATSRLG
jgi:hypothetical protein